MGETKSDYSFVPNPGLRQPHGLPPSPKMKIAILKGSGRGVWPEEYKHLDTGKPLIQELIDLEIQKYLGNDAWLDTAGRRLVSTPSTKKREHTAGQKMVQEK